MAFARVRFVGQLGAVALFSACAAEKEEALPIGVKSAQSIEQISDAKEARRCQKMREDGKIPKSGRIEETMARYDHAWPDETPPIPEVTEHTIRRFAYGIGDDNPLWTDKEYAKNTRYGDIIAPPSIVLGCGGMGIVRGQMPPSWRRERARPTDVEGGRRELDQSGMGEDAAGFSGWYSGSQIKWFRAVRPGDHLQNLNYIFSMERKSSEFGGENTLKLTYGVEFRNPRNELVCRCHNWDFVALRKEAKEKGKYMLLELKDHWSDEELRPIWEQYEKEYELRRNANPRFWEDVEMGEEWKMAKGPYTASSGIAYTIGAIGETFIKTDRLAYRTYVRDHPAVGIKNEMNMPDAPVRVHWENELPKREGIPAAYDFGGQRIAWLAQMVTDWMGDDGFLETLEGEFIKFNYLGDVQWFTAKIIDKFIVTDDHLIRCEISAVNQRNEITTTGAATVALPSRGTGRWPLDSRLGSRL